MATSTNPTAVDPYAPPAAAVADHERTDAPRLWNPNAAANWSLLFSAAFGATLVYLNWKALGDRRAARKALGWLYMSAAGILLVHVSAFAMLLTLLVWYFGCGRPHANYVRARFGADYPRRRWLKPLGVAILGMIAYSVVSEVMVATGIPEPIAYIASTPLFVTGLALHVSAMRIPRAADLQKVS